MFIYVHKGMERTLSVTALRGLVHKTWECKMECGKTDQHGCRTKYVFTLPWINTKSPHFIRSSGFKVRVSQGCCSHSPGQSAAVLKGRPGCCHSSPSQGGTARGGRAASDHTEREACRTSQGAAHQAGPRRWDQGGRATTSRWRASREGWGDPVEVGAGAADVEATITGGERSLRKREVGDLPETIRTGRGRRPVQESHRSLKERFNRRRRRR